MDILPGAKVRLTVPQWLAYNESLATREFVGEILRVTEKGLQFSGHASIRKTDHCLRCGRFIENPVSVEVGYGPICSGYLGIPRDFDESELEDIRARAIEHTQITRWFPRSKTEVEILEQGTAQPKEHETVIRLGMMEIDGQDRIILSGNTYPYREQIKLAPGRKWSPELKLWHLPASPAALTDLRERLADIPDEIKMTPDLIPLRDQALREAEASGLKSSTDLPAIPVTSAIEPWVHQLQAYHFASHIPATLLSMVPGAGKSRVVVDLVANRGFKKILIVCPPSVDRVWPREFRKWSGIPVDAQVLRGSVAKKTKQAQEALRKGELMGHPVAVSINYESARRFPFGPDIGARGGIKERGWAMDAGFDLIVMDESHKLKSPYGVTSMAIGHIAGEIPNRLALTGTALAHSPLDIWAQYRALDPTIFPPTFGIFRRRYAVMGGYQGKQVVDYQNQEELQRKIYTIAYHAGEEVLDLPPETESEKIFSLSAAGQKAHDEVMNDLITQIRSERGETGSVVVTNVLTKLLRAQQITGGWVPPISEDPLEDSVEPWRVDREKEKALIEYLEEIPQDRPAVVFCRFSKDLESVQAAAEATGRVYGEISGSRKDLTEDALMPEGIDLMGVQIQSGGTGIDLTRANYAIYYSLGFSLSDYIQSRRRVHRPGQKHTTHFVKLIAEGTIDEKVYAALQNRQELVEAIISFALDEDHADILGDYDPEGDYPTWMDATGQDEEIFGVRR